MISIPKGGASARIACGCGPRSFWWRSSFSAPARAYEHRTSTPSFGVQFGYGRLLKAEKFHVQDWPIGGGRHDSGRFQDDGRLQLRTDRLCTSESASSWTEATRWDSDSTTFATSERAATTGTNGRRCPGWLKFTTVHADYYLYFRRRMQVSYYVAPFVGIQQQELRFKKSDIAIEGVSTPLRRRRWCRVLRHAVVQCRSERRGVFALEGQNATNVALQPALGIHFYVI